MPTMQDVKDAMQRVQDSLRAHLPKELLAYKADQITILASEDQWKTAFRFIYDVVFKPANQFKQEAGDFIDGVLGFVTPTFDHQKRRIYISPKAQGYSQDVQQMILSHEYIHWLSHQAFYPSMYMIGGDCPFRVEGVTQWLTVKRCGYQREFNLLPAYRDEMLKTDSWLGGSPGNEQLMLDYIFKGKKTDLNGIRR